MGPTELVPRVGSTKSINQQLFCYLRVLAPRESVTLMKYERKYVPIYTVDIT